MIYVGVDPGSTGACAFLDGHEAWGDLVDTRDAHALADLLRPLRERLPGVLVAVEKVQAMPGGGKRRMGATSAFSFGYSAGTIEGVCVALGLPTTLVAPQRWVPIALANRARPAEQKARKEAIRAAARSRWPAVGLSRVKDGALADALWIAEAARRESLGEVA